MIFLFEVLKIIKVEKQCLLLNYDFIKKNQKHPLKPNIFDKKKHDIQDFGNAPSLMFLNFQKK